MCLDEHLLEALSKLLKKTIVVLIRSIYDRSKSAAIIVEPQHYLRLTRQT